MTAAFSTLALTPQLADNLPRLGLKHMTPIQTASLPLILAGKDVLGKAKTGSGKTLAFTLGLLNKLDLECQQTQALVICPTRELADQVAEEIRRIGRTMQNMKVLTLCGGVPMGPQISSLRHLAHVVVGTPGRLMDHLLKRRLNLSAVDTLVLDEADRMLEMGFADELAVVTKHLPVDRQTLLFSATYPDQIKQISLQLQRSPQQVSVEASHDSSKIRQVFFEVQDAHRLKAAAALLSEYQPASCMLFCSTKVSCQQVAEQLAELGFSVIALHGDLTQQARTQALIRFANQSVRVLVATDVAARGLDIEAVEAVINYHISAEPDVHTHRIGRTGRADAKGLALTLCTPQEADKANRIEQFQGKLTWKGIQALRFHANRIVPPLYQTLCVDGGKKAKLRPGDILGALTQDAQVPGEDIGKIKITATHSYVAIKTRSMKRSLRLFREGRIKGRRFKARKLG